MEKQPPRPNGPPPGLPETHDISNPEHFRHVGHVDQENATLELVKVSGLLVKCH